MRTLKIISLLLALQFLLYVLYLFVISGFTDSVKIMLGIELCVILNLMLFDKYLLFIFKIRECFDSSIIDIFENHMGRLGVENVGIFVSKKYASDVYVFQGLGKRKNIIIGEKVISELSFKEKEAVITLALKTLSSGRGAFVSLATSLLFLIMAPVLVALQIFRYRPFKFVRGVFYVFYSITLLINQLFCIEKKTLFKIKYQVIDYLDEKNNLESAVYRISSMDDRKHYRIEDTIIMNLRLVNKKESLLDEIFKVGTETKQRYKGLEAV